jgi:hypothetical protein
MMRTQKLYYLAPCLLVLVIGVLLATGGFGKHEKSTDELVKDLSSSREKDRTIAVRTLKVRPEEAPEVVPALVKALKDPQSDIRLSSAIKLGLFGENAKDAIPALKEALSDKDGRVRRAAAKSLGQIDATAAPATNSQPQ